MLLFGVTLTTLGSVLPPLIARFALEKTAAASLMAMMSGGILAGALVFGPAVDRIGYRPVLVAGALAVGLGLVALACSPTPKLLTPAILIFGWGGGLLNGATNALMADMSPEGRESGLALLGVFFGIGAVGVPLVLGLLLRWATYTTIVAGLACLVVIPLFDFLTVRFPPPKQAQGFPLGRVGSLLGDATLLLVGLLLFFQSGMEITLGGWSAQYVREVLMPSEEWSILLLSLFWVGMVVARLVLTQVLRFFSPALVFPMFMVVALAGAAFLLAVPNIVAAGTGLFLLGFGLASGFPILLGFLGGLYHDLTGTAFSAVFVIALLGGSALPFLTGVLADRHGLRASLLVVPIALVGQGALYFLLRRRLAAIS
jgi:fucose permease